MTGAVLDTSQDAVDPNPRCDVCAHALADHDAISTRYCQATQAQALSRACICPTGH